MSVFSLPDTFELLDIVSLQSNNLNPRIATVHGKKTITLSLGPTMIYELDNLGKEALIAVNVGDTEPLIILAKQIPDLPAASVKEWQANFGFVFQNPSEENPLKLFGAQFITNPQQRKYNRTLPKVISDETADSPHINAGVGAGLIKGQNNLDQLVGSITIYEADDEESFDHFMVLITFCSSQAQETGGLMTLYVGHQIKPSEIK
jgi:hypothetical protein